jgi:hypothetical protein
VVRFADPDGDEVVVTVRRATATDGVRRGSLKQRVTEKWAPILKANEAMEFQEFLEIHPEWLIETTVYPGVIACTTEATGIPWPIPPGDFCQLPDDLVDRWTDAVYRLNPHWAPDYEERMPAQEKKSDGAS